MSGDEERDSDSRDFPTDWEDEHDFPDDWDDFTAEHKTRWYELAEKLCSGHGTAFPIGWETGYAFPDDWEDLGDEERDKWFHQARSFKHATEQDTNFARHVKKLQEREQRRQEASSDTWEVKR